MVHDYMWCSTARYRVQHCAGLLNQRRVWGLLIVGAQAWRGVLVPLTLTLTLTLTLIGLVRSVSTRQDLR